MRACARARACVRVCVCVLNVCIHINVIYVLCQRLQNDIFHLSKLCRDSNSRNDYIGGEKYNSGKFEHTVMLIRGCLIDCKMTFLISRSFVENQFLEIVIYAESNITVKTPLYR